MNEHKYRVWNESFTEFHINTLTELIGGMYYEDAVKSTFEQFAEQPDKEGVDIYAGDLIDVMRGKEVVLSAKEVFYHKGCPCFDIEYDGEISPLYWYEEDEKFEFKIVGNIHQKNN